MKKTLLITILILTIANSYGFPASLWEEQDTGDDFRFSSIFFLDNGADGWISAYGYEDYNYLILRTTDSGNNWASQEPNISGIFSKMFFMDADNGWALEDEDVYHTADGGINWEVQEVSSTIDSYSYGNTLSDIFFVDATHGWIVGSEIIHKTEDGSTWVMKSTDTVADIDLQSVYFVNQSSGWVVGYTSDSGDCQAVVLHTYDGGESWEEQAIDANVSLYSVDFIDVNNGWAVGSYGRVFHTDNGGTTWTLQETNIYDETFREVDFIDAGNGWIRASGGSIFKSTNGGIDWVKKIDGDVYYNYDGVEKRKRIPGELVVLETDSIKESNGIKNSDALTNFRTSGFCVIDSSNVWLIENYYSNSKLVKTEDGGENWKLAEGGISSIQSIFFTDSNKGWVVGDNGIVLSTEDGGLNWDMLDTGTTGYLRDVYFNDDNNGWIVGDSVVHGTGNGGATWDLLAKPTNYLLYNCHFADNSNGWAVGYDKVSDRSKIMNTANGGSVWNEQYSGAEEARLYGVYFADVNNGWAVGTDNIILHTSNGGGNWEIQASTADITLHDVYFINSTTGWACGDQARILHTSDGGETWVDSSIEDFSYNSYSEQEPGVYFDISYYNPYDLKDIHFIDETNGWIVSDYGIIVYTKDGGSTWHWKEIDIEGTSDSYYSRYMTAVFFVDEDNGWIAGSRGMFKLKNMGIVETSEVDNKLIIGNNVLNILENEKAYIYWDDMLTNVTIKIFTLDGTLIRMFDAVDLIMEDHIEWYGTFRGDDSYDADYVSQGVYLVLLESDEGKEVEKIFVVKK